jgi:uncharacterized protein YsxB (DUF464 family)
MIKIAISRLNGEVRSIVIDGHAYSGEEGKDLVCAGVSACYCGAIAALESARGDKIGEKSSSGHAEVRVIKDVSPHDQAVLNVLAEQLKYLARENPKFVNVAVVDQ